MINYNELLKGLYGDHLKRVNELNELYALYNGEQKWDTPQDLDYEPTKKVTNYIKKLISTKARFMFGMNPFFDIKQVIPDAEPQKVANVFEERAMPEQGATPHADKAQEKEDLLAYILKENKFHKKLLKGRKDCSIGGRVAIKLWAHVAKGIKIIFSPAQEFFPEYNIDDVDELRKVTFLYILEDSIHEKDQRINKQTWELVGTEEGKEVCILNEAIYDGNGDIVDIIEQDYDTGLNFIPVIIIQNGGLTGETEGESDVLELWQNQDLYNRLNSDDVDALKFNMFPQTVATDAAEESLDSLKISPGALVDLQTDPMAGADGKQAKMEALEKKFNYHAKFEDTVERIKNDMYDLMEVPNVSLDQLKGVMTSGKSMRALYWGLIAVCEEDATEWIPALEQMVDYIFGIINQYNLYPEKKGRELAAYETTLEIVREYPIQEDVDAQKAVDMDEVITEVRSKRSYMNKWGEYEDVDSELEQIMLEKELLADNFDVDLEASAAEEDDSNTIDTEKDSNAAQTGTERQTTTTAEEGE